MSGGTQPSGNTIHSLEVGGNDTENHCVCRWQHSVEVRLPPVAKCAIHDGIASCSVVSWVAAGVDVAAACAKIRCLGQNY